MNRLIRGSDLPPARQPVRRNVDKNGALEFSMLLATSVRPIDLEGDRIGRPLTLLAIQTQGRES